jgi:hypothetical protein
MYNYTVFKVIQDSHSFLYVIENRKCELRVTAVQEKRSNMGNFTYGHFQGPLQLCARFQVIPWFNVVLIIQLKLFVTTFIIRDGNLFHVALVPAKMRRNNMLESSNNADVLCPVCASLALLEFFFLH